VNRIKYDLFIRVRCKIRTFISSLSIVLLLVICFEVHAQNQQIIVSKNAISVLNKKDNSFSVFDDSTYYWKIKSNGTKWEKHNLVFQSNEISFMEFEREYTPLGLTNGRILFCNKGVGTVYELLKDTIRRIDRSFDHRNQYYSTLFGYKNVVYAFGGYGLFETKNLFVSYHNQFNEWKQVISDRAIEPRMSHDYQLGENSIYIFGGYNKNDADISIEHKDCWEYKFSDRKWVKLGKLNVEFDNPVEKPDYGDCHLVFMEPFILRLDFKENKVIKYADPNSYSTSKAQLDTSGNHILLKYKYDGSSFMPEHKRDTRVVFSYQKTKDILTNKISEGQLYTPSATYINYLMVIVFFVMGVAFLVYRTRKRTKKVKQHKNSQKIINKNGLFNIYDRPVEDYFDGFELILLQKFLNAPEEYISLNELDELCNPDRKASYVSAKKRREKSLRIIKEKLAITLDINSKEVFIEIRDGEDKRIKKMKLNTLELLSDNISNNSI